MASEQERKDPEKRKELDEKAQRGEVAVPGGTGGFSLEAQERLAEGRSRGGHSRTTAEKKGEDEEVLRQVKEQTEAKPE